MIKVKIIQQYQSEMGEFEKAVNSFLEEGHTIYEIKFQPSSHGNRTIMIIYEDGKPKGSQYAKPPKSPVIYSEPDTLEVQREE